MKAAINKHCNNCYSTRCHLPFWNNYWEEQCQDTWQSAIGAGHIINAQICSWAWVKQTTSIHINGVSKVHPSTNNNKHWQ